MHHLATTTNTMAWDGKMGKDYMILNDATTAIISPSIVTYCYLSTNFHHAIAPSSILLTFSPRCLEYLVYRRSLFIIYHFLVPTVPVDSFPCCCLPLSNPYRVYLFRFLSAISNGHIGYLLTAPNRLGLLMSVSLIPMPVFSLLFPFLFTLVGRIEKWISSITCLQSFWSRWSIQISENVNSKTSYPYVKASGTGGNDGMWLVIRY